MPTSTPDKYQGLYNPERHESKPVTHSNQVYIKKYIYNLNRVASNKRYAGYEKQKVKFIENPIHKSQK